MSHSPTSDDKYSVEFDRTCAWSLIYADQEGRLSFVFEPGEEKKRIYLNPHASIDRKMPEAEFYLTPRYMLALERTKKYLISCGYIVFIDEEKPA
jgi:hypothetical protein